MTGAWDLIGGNPILKFFRRVGRCFVGKGREEGESEGNVNCESPMKVLEVLEVGKWKLWKDDWRLGPFRRKPNVKSFRRLGRWFRCKRERGRREGGGCEL